MKRGTTAVATAQRRPRLRKAHIVVHAADLFSEKGFAAVGVQEIGERVGISGGAIYRHFPSKDALLHAVLLETIEAWVAAAGDGSDAAPAGDPIARIRRAVERAVDLVVDRPGQLATYVRERHRADKPTRRMLARREAELTERWFSAILATRPELSPAEMIVRHQAMNGVMVSLARRPVVLANARFRSLVTEGLLGVLLATPVAAFAAVPAAQRSWVAPVSRRQRILSAALRLFRERGYHGVGMDEIGAAAGIAGPSIYEWFEGKAEILLDAYGQAEALVMAGAADALATSESAADALDRLAKSFIEICFDQVDLIVVTTREGHALPESERPRLRRRQRDLDEMWTGVVREVRPELAPGDARSLVRAVFPLILQVALGRRGGSPAVDEAAGLVRAFLVGNSGESKEER